LSTLQFPSTNRYQEDVAAWVRFTPSEFSTLPEKRIASKGSVDFHEFILPLQGYQSPNAIDFQEIEPGLLAQVGMSVRDAFAGAGASPAPGGVARFSNLVSGVFQGFFGVNLNEMAGGAEGLAQTDASYSDLKYKKALKRVHTFKFTLFPKNAQDAAIIDSIANLFQAHMYPVMKNELDNTVQTPNMWRISITPNGGAENSKVLSNSIQCSVLTYFNVNRLDANAPVLTTDNYYAGLAMECVFHELESVYKKISSNPASGSGERNFDLLNRSTLTNRGIQL
jgi:hypothetical protein